MISAKRAIAAIMSMIVVATTYCTACDSNNQHPIVGTWELVEIRGDYAGDLDFFIGLLDVYHEDGTGISSFAREYPDYGERFLWTIDGNILTVAWLDDYVWLAEDWVASFEISGSQLTATNLHGSDLTWIWRLVEGADDNQISTVDDSINAIIGTWKLVDIGDEWPEGDVFLGMIDTFNTDGTGSSNFHGDIDTFLWEINQDTLTMFWDNDWPDSYMSFEISGSALTVYRQNSADLPDFRWVFNRVE